MEARSTGQADKAEGSVASKDISGPPGLDAVRPTAPSTLHLFTSWNNKLPEGGSDRAQVISAETIRKATDEIEAKSSKRPIKDGIDIGPDEPAEFEVPNELTTDEETEHPGTISPKKGAGWWGFGPPIRPLKKGIPRDSVDGGGLCSPGRWPIDRRRVPEDFTAERLQKTIFAGLIKCEQIWKW